MPVRAVVSSVVVVAALFAPARADYRSVIDRVTLEPSTITGQRLRVNMSLVSLTGQIVDTPDSKSIKLMVGTSKLDVPLALGLYGATNADTAIVFVIQASFDFSDVLPVIGEAIDQNVLATANDRTQVGLLMFGESFGSARLGSAKSGRNKISGMSSDGSLGQPVLLDSIDRALGLLKKAKTDPEGRPIRKMIVLVSDGRDASAGPGTPAGDKERVIKLGERAAKDDVRIHSFAYSPKDNRKPLLMLGELSKRSLGTFRWVRGARADSWTPVFQQLQAEIAKQIVLTFFLPLEEDLSNRKITIVTSGRAEATSNEHKVPDVGCAGQPCEPGAYCTGERCLVPMTEPGGSVLKWTFMILLIIVALLVTLGVVGYFLTKRQHAAADPNAPPGPPKPSKKPSKLPKIPTVLPTAPPSMAPPSSPPAAAAPTTGPRFYIMNGPREGEEIALKHGFTIGKLAGCDLVIDDGYASSTHAQIGMDHFGNCRLYDRQSTNGTFVNGVRVNNEYPLEHGNTVRIGSIDLRFLSQ